MDVNVNGVLYTAQAAGQQMVRFGIPGSIILVSSISGTITNKVRNPSVEATTLLWQLTGILATRQDHAWVPYNASKSAVLQMTRSMACELGNRGIRVNSLSPGHIYTR
jgi:NAD(P)-dependent dehydrogenase (short-subunit alcohol dehydrogenase family)